MKHISIEEIYLKELNNQNNWDDLYKHYEISDEIIKGWYNK